MFSCINAGVFQQLRCLQFNTRTVKLPKQCHGPTFFKEGQKGTLKL